MKNKHDPFEQKHLFPDSAPQPPEVFDLDAYDPERPKAALARHG